jgi:hypothetical protein
MGWIGVVVALGDARVLEGRAVEGDLRVGQRQLHALRDPPSPCVEGIINEVIPSRIAD